MNIKQKFNSIDQSKLEAKQVEILKSIKEKTNDFKTKDQEVVSKIDMALDKIISALKEKNPEAIKSTSKTKTPKSGSGSKRTLFSIAKEIRKSNETWEEAKSRAKKIMSEESQQTTQKMKSETEKLLAFIKRKKELDGLSGTSVKKDSKIEALPKGRRVSKKGWKNQYGESEGGRVYYENRDNRTDRLAPSFADKIYLAEGGGVGAKTLYSLDQIEYSVEYSDKDGKTYNETFKTKDEALNGIYELKKLGYNIISRTRHFKDDGTFNGFFSEGGYADKGVYVETLDEEIDLSDDAKLRARKTQQGGNKSFGERREMHGASPEALAFGNGGYVVIAKSEKGGGFVMSKPTSKLKAEKLKSLLPKIDGESNEVMTLNKASKLSGLVGKEYLKYADGGAIIGTPETPLARGLDIDYTGLVGETGGMSAGELFADGGGIPNNYEGRMPEDIWNNLTLEQREHFLKDHFLNNSEKFMDRVEYSKALNQISETKNKDWNNLPRLAQMEFERHVFMGQYAFGGRTRERKYLNHSQKHEVRYSKDKPHRRGYGYETGGETRKMQLGEPVIYKGETWEVTQKNGVVGLTSMRQGAWGSDFPFVPISKIDARREVKDFYGNEVRIPYLVEDFEEGGFMTDPNFGDFQSGVYAGGGEIRVGDKVKVKASGIGEDYAIVKGFDSDKEMLTKNDDPNTYLVVKDSNGFLWEIYLKEVVGFPMKRKFDDGGEVSFIDYKDSEIMYEPNYKKYYANDVEFDSLQEAKDFLDSGEIDPSIRDAYKRGLFETGGGVEKDKLYYKPVKVEKKDVFKFKKILKSKGISSPYNKDISDKQFNLNQVEFYFKNEKDREVAFSEYHQLYETGGGVGKLSFDEWMKQNNIDVYKRTYYWVADDGGNDYLYSGSKLEVMKSLKEDWKKAETKKSPKELRNEYLEKLGSKEADVWDKIGAESGSQIRNSDKMLKSYAEGVEEMLQKEGVGKGSFDQEDYDFYTDENWHLFNEFLVWNGYYEPEMTKTEKEWREKNYADPKKRNYVSNPSVISVSGSSKLKSTNYVPKGKIATITIVKDGKEMVFLPSQVLNGVNLYKGGGKIKNDYVYIAKRYVKEVHYDDGKDLKVVKPSNGYWVEKSALKSFNKKFEGGGKTTNNEPREGDLITNIGTYGSRITKVADSYVEFYDNKAMKIVVCKKSDLVLNNLDDDGDDDGYYEDEPNSWICKKSYKGGGKTTFKEKATAIAKNFEGKKVEPKYQKEYGKTYDKAEAKEVGNKIAGSQKAKYDSKMSGGGKTKRGGAMQLAKQIRKDGESWQSALKRANEQMRKK